MDMKTIREKILEIAETQSVFRAGDIPGIAEPRSTLCRMVERKELIRIGRGLYALPNGDISENYSLAEATQRYPDGVICLISALYFHNIGTQIPYETWIMRQDRRVAPSKGLPVRFVYCTDDTFTYGVEKHIIDGTEVSIYSPAKTVADCFKYRNKIGLDVAIEALREAWGEKRFTMNELWAAGKICRVSRVMQPYVEMLVQ